MILVPLSANPAATKAAVEQIAADFHYRLISVDQVYDDLLRMIDPVVDGTASAVANLSRGSGRYAAYDEKLTISLAPKNEQRRLLERTETAVAEVFGSDIAAQVAAERAVEAGEAVVHVTSRAELEVFEAVGALTLRVMPTDKSGNEVQSPDGNWVLGIDVSGQPYGWPTRVPFAWQPEVDYQPILRAVRLIEDEERRIAGPVKR